MPLVSSFPSRWLQRIRESFHHFSLSFICFLAFLSRVTLLCLLKTTKKIYQMFVMGSGIFAAWYCISIFLNLLTCLVKYYIEGLFYAGLFYFCQIVLPAGNILKSLARVLICKKKKHAKTKKRNAWKEEKGKIDCILPKKAASLPSSLQLLSSLHFNTTTILLSNCCPFYLLLSFLTPSIWKESRSEWSLVFLLNNVFCISLHSTHQCNYCTCIFSSLSLPTFQVHKLS